MVKSHSADGLAWAPNRDLTRSQLDDRAALYADRGYLVVNVEGDEASPNHYGGIGGIWIKNAKRFRFSLRDPLDVAITNYLATYTDTTNVPRSQTGISVDVIQNGDAVYRHGLGMCDPTMAHLADLPDHHARTVEQLTAHLGCVVHYPQDTQPGCANCTTHCATALDVAEAIWGTGLVTTHDDRLWTPVDATCAAAGGGTGRNGVGWVLRTVGGWCVAVHGGSWTSARSHLRVYRDDGLVIAILTNERGHTPSGLATTIGNIILAP